MEGRVRRLCGIAVGETAERADGAVAAERGDAHEVPVPRKVRVACMR